MGELNESFAKSIVHGCRNGSYYRDSERKAQRS